MSSSQYTYTKTVEKTESAPVTQNVEYTSAPVQTYPKPITIGEDTNEGKSQHETTEYTTLPDGTKIVKKVVTHSDGSQSTIDDPEVKLQLEKQKRGMA